jgi:hypothetical protein
LSEVAGLGINTNVRETSLDLGAAELAIRAPDFKALASAVELGYL